MTVFAAAETTDSLGKDAEVSIETCSATVRVTGIVVADIDEEMLQMMFENKRYGGGAIESLSLDHLQTSAIITYQEAEGNVNLYYFLQPTEFCTLNTHV